MSSNMRKGILSGDIYDVITGVVKRTGCYDYEHNYLVSEGKCYIVEIESTSPIKRLAVPMSFWLDEGDQIRAFFEKGKSVHVGQSLERRLEEIKTPKIIQTAPGNYVTDECDVDQELEKIESYHNHLIDTQLGKII